MNKVWVVTLDHSDGKRVVVAVFSTVQKAQAFIDASEYRGWHRFAFEVDEADGGHAEVSE